MPEAASGGGQAELAGTYDYLIIGGGSAGCVMARRLSADPRVSVLLCEAGADISPDDVPAAIADSYPGLASRNPAYQWPGLVATYVHGGNNPIARGYEQARVLGGGSSINGQFFNRGLPADYDLWESLGAEGWNWECVLPFFKRAETDTDFDDDMHGRDGPIRVRRLFPPQWPEHALAVGKGLDQLGYPYLADQNGSFGDGYFPIAISNFEERRESTATTYLDMKTRRRPNLRILTGAETSQLLFESGVCAGAVIEHGGKSQEVPAMEVIVCCGAIGSPALLMRSGIGPGAHLRQMGIDVIAALPGVGRNLMEHPSIALASFIHRKARINAASRHHIRVGARYSSHYPGAPVSDMAMVGVTRTAWHRVGAQIGTLMTYVNAAYSKDGEVALVAPDWRTPPQVALNLLSDPRDFERLVGGFRWMAALQATEAMQAVTAEPFPASYSERVRKSSAVSRSNWLATGVLSLLLDGPARLRALLMHRVVAGGPALRELLADEDALRGFVRGACTGTWHVSCSCRMGAADDPKAVVDRQGRVYGVSGLRVVDASIFPNMPSANTNAPTIMVAEKIAAEMIRDGQEKALVREIC